MRPFYPKIEEATVHGKDNRPESHARLGGGSCDFYSIGDHFIHLFITRKFSVLIFLIDTLNLKGFSGAVRFGTSGGEAYAISLSSLTR